MTLGPNLRIAIVGAGLMGRAHARAARQAGSHVVAIADTDPSLARSLASAIGAQVLSGSVDAVVTADRVDAVHVSTPAAEHAPICALALSRGIHVLCEKPLTETSAEAHALLDLAASNELVLCPVHQFPFQQGAIAAAARLPAIGRVRWITAELCTAGASDRVDSLQNDVILNILPHPLSLTHCFLGGRLADGEWGVTSPGAGELLVAGTIRGTGVSILLSTHGRPTGNFMRLIGERGSISLDLFHGFSTLEAGRVSRFTKMARPFTSSGRTLAVATANSARRAMARETAFPGLKELCARFYLAAARRADPPVSMAEILDIATVRDLVRDSVRAIALS